ncbi:MAG TPA: DUF2339 domain-containing protein, partial [Candidatus Acidoferrales bacterium]|nr:DUF2339 domain-containing protein [Candidatus Acidoferrales bacterium]
MELIIVLLLLGALVVLVTAVLVIWLIASTNSSKERIAELTQRVDNLQAELVLMRRTPSPAPAPAPTPKAEPAPEPKAESTPAPEPLPVVEPAFEPVEFTPTPEPPPPPIIPETAAFTPPPPIIPPLPPTPPPPPPYIRPEIKPEPVAETMQADTMQNSTADETPPPLPTPAKEKASFEMRLGTFWFVRVGIVLVVTSLAFFANYAYHHIIGKLGPAGKISLLYLASGLLLGAGAWWQRSNVKESLKNYAQVLFAGGLAAVYFTTYAAH